MTTTIDSRQLIPVDYKQLPTEDLLQLRTSITHTLQANDQSYAALHRELTAIRIEIASRSLNEPQTEAVKQP